MHTLFQLPDKLLNPQQSAFYDEIIKMHKEAPHQIDVDFQLRTKIEKIIQENGKSKRRERKRRETKMERNR